MFKTIFSRFPGIFIEKTTFEGFEKSAVMKKKQLLLLLIYIITNEKYVPEHLITTFIAFFFDVFE